MMNGHTPLYVCVKRCATCKRGTFNVADLNDNVCHVDWTCPTRHTRPPRYDTTSPIDIMTQWHTLCAWLSGSTAQDMLDLRRLRVQLFTTHHINGLHALKRVESGDDIMLDNGGDTTIAMRMANTPSPPPELPTRNN